MTKTNTQMLADLNALRVAKGLKPLKAWKESTVKLAECLAKMGGKIAQPDTTTTVASLAEATGKSKSIAGDAVSLMKDVVAKAPKTVVEKPAKVEPKAVKAAPASNNRKGIRTLSEGEVHLTTIANSMKLAPKAARAVARQHKAAIAKLQVSGKKYVFPKTNVAAVRAILETPAKGK